MSDFPLMVFWSTMGSGPAKAGIQENIEEKHDADGLGCKGQKPRSWALMSLLHPKCKEAEVEGEARWKWRAGLFFYLSRAAVTSFRHHASASLCGDRRPPFSARIYSSQCYSSKRSFLELEIGTRHPGNDVDEFWACKSFRSFRGRIGFWKSQLPGMERRI